jgi:thiopeptide-type bacteriocin biosynthesis protein
MAIQLLTTAVLRTPAFATQDELIAQWKALKALIAEASPAFYRQIQNVEAEELKTLPEKIQTTIRKYFNRARFRPTPFGGFAAISPVVLATGKQPLVTLKNEIRSLQLPDWKLIVEESAIKGDLRNENQLQANATIYRVGEELRYIGRGSGGFQLKTVAGDELIYSIINFCSKTASVAETIGALMTQFGLEAEVLTDILQQLIDLEILFIDSRPNITGSDYTLRRALSNLPGAVYRIDQRAVENDAIQAEIFDDLGEFLQWWHRILPNRPQPDLKNFMQAFRRRFGDTSVPLGEALDPELGVGYLGLEEEVTASMDQQLLRTGKQIGANGEASAGLWNSELLTCLRNGIAKGDPIRLEAFKVTATNHRYPLPNTFSVLVSFQDGVPVLENAGGCTGNALLGRFTLAGDVFKTMAVKLAAIEQSANPDVLFFEIAYAGEPEIDNINRRYSPYDYELPLLTWSLSKHPIRLADIQVFLEGEEIILWSAEHGKRMVPRLSSAYNFKRSNLSVFRFLCDLQFQSIEADLNFKLNELIPECEEYPRVYFKNVIVSPAMWQIPVRFKQLSAEEIRDAVPELTAWLSRVGVSRCFKFGVQDQTLVFDRFDRRDLSLFLRLCSREQYRNLLISETGVASGITLSEGGQSYCAQVVLNYYHRARVYTTPAILDLQKRILSHMHSAPRSLFLPGSDWMYFEIYGHPIRSNGILLQECHAFITSNDKLVDKWFFIRYDAPSPHIRLRLKLNDEGDAGILLAGFERILKPAIQKKYIYDVQVKSYFPEYQRYGLAGMDLVETIFWRDSIYVLSLLAEQHSLEILYSVTLQFMDQVFSCLYFSLEQRMDVVRKIASGFAHEFEWNTAAFKVINTRFKRISGNFHPDARMDELKIPAQLLSRIRQVCGRDDLEPMLIEKLVTDMIHMHINRLFSSYQRAHEGILYQYLFRYLKMHAGRSINQQVS